QLRPMSYRGFLVRRAGHRRGRCVWPKPRGRGHPPPVPRSGRPDRLGHEHSRLRQAVWPTRDQSWPHAALRRHAGPRPDQGHRRLRAHPVIETLAFALKWDPQIHGLLVVLLAIVLLPGSVYLLLSTNMGARVGFLIAAAGLFGWMTLMAIIWTVYGIGFTGNPGKWAVEQVIPGNLGTSTLPVLDGFPRGWHQIQVTDP